MHSIQAIGIQWLITSALSTLAAGYASANDTRAPCPKIVLNGAADIRLTEVEQKLVCGDPASEGWKNIPLNEALYFMESFLQQRGYQNPKHRTENGVLIIDVGAKSIIRGLKVDGLPPEIDPGKLRKIIGQTLTPAQLNKLKSTLLNQLQNQGYACPQISVTANAQTGELFAEVDKGRLYLLEAIIPAALPDVDHSIFHRYEAFMSGRRFDMRLLTLTAERVLADSLFLNAFYDVACSSEGALRITQRVTEGKPQLYRVGVGFDTEDFAIGKAQWRNSKIGNQVSSLDGSLYISYREQTAETSMRYYFSPSPRQHLRPRLYFRRQNELQFESFDSQASLMPATSWDNRTLRVDLTAGPALKRVETLRGAGPGVDTFIALNTKLALTDHMFEYYSGEPRSGWKTSLESSSRVKGAYSDLTAHRVSLQGEMLWNLGQYDPPLLVIGTRYWAGTIYVTDHAAALRSLPPDGRLFLGGDANLRGAARNELPDDDVGFLTAVYHGLELRLGDILYGIQPLIFLDTAMAGRSSVHLDRDVYWSPGTGFRWRLPIGSIRGTFARGNIWRREPAAPPLYKSHWQFYFSFGKEF